MEFRRGQIFRAVERGEGADISDFGLNEVETKVAKYAASLRRSYMMDSNEAITKTCNRLGDVLAGR